MVGQRHCGACNTNVLSELRFSTSLDKVWMFLLKIQTFSKLCPCPNYVHSLYRLQIIQVIIGRNSSRSRNEKIHSSGHFWNETEKKFFFLEELELQFQIQLELISVLFRNWSGTGTLPVPFQFRSRNCTPMTAVPVH